VSKQTDPDRRPTKAERKEQARLDRIGLERKMERRRRASRRALIVGIAAAVVVGIIVFALSRNTGSSNAGGSSPTVDLPNPNDLPGILKTAPPWNNNIEQADARLAALGLPQLSDTILHHHTDLVIYINGQQVTIPPNVGLNDSDPTVASPLHTHGSLGTVHIESADPNFQPVLGQFMDVWGVYFTKDCLGGSCAAGETKLRAYVDGEEWSGDPTQIPLNDGEVIVLTFGTADQVPADLNPAFNIEGSPTPAP
jgi:hypothetical protein